jgi:hypothetical protein
LRLPAYSASEKLIWLIVARSVTCLHRSCKKHALVQTFLSLMGGISPGASHIALSLAGPAGASLDSFTSPDRDPSLPAASAVFAESTTIAQLEIASF